MKRTALLFLLLACFVQDTYSHTPWMTVHSSYSFLKNPNFRMGLDLYFRDDDAPELRLDPFATSVIQDVHNKKVLIASNSIFLLPVAAVKILDIDYPKYIYLIMIPALITNFSFSYPVIPEMVKLNLKHHTDCFFFYKISKVCLETSLGVEFDYNKTGITASVCMPWNKGYTGMDKAMRPFFSAGFTYTF